LARTLDAELVYRGRQLGQGDVERRQIIGAGQRVVGKRAAQQLARLPVVNQLSDRIQSQPRLPGRRASRPGVSGLD
jgi:hypothetical protein